LAQEYQFPELERTTCYQCGVEFASPALEQRRRDGKSFWCPNGHCQCWTETESSRLRKELEKTKEYLSSAQVDRDVARNDAKWARATAKGNATKLRNIKERIGRGVCPCCNRTFVQLARHMADKHPKYIAEAKQ